MQITQSPFVPMNRAQYELEKLKNQPGILGKIYPEIYRCLQCNTCTRVCPMEIQVMDYMAHAIRGDVEGVAMLSFQCIRAEPVRRNVRRRSRNPMLPSLPGGFMDGTSSRSPKASIRGSVRSSKEDMIRLLKKLAQLSVEELMKIYTQRDQEPQESQTWVPKHPDFLEKME